MKGKRIGDWYKGGIATMWFEHQLRKVGIDPEREVEWKVGYLYGSMREAWKPLLRRETDAAIVANAFVPTLLEQGFNKIYDFVEDSKPHGRPDRRMAPENFPFHRYVEAKLRVDNPDEAERMRDLLSPTLMESYFVPLERRGSVAHS